MNLRITTHTPATIAKTTTIATLENGPFAIFVIVVIVAQTAFDANECE